MGQQHSHDHGGNHGHSHGGDHGHSHGAQQHGHSHNGKPCHGHGPQAAAPKPAQAHGHSHNGKPCHGHGPQAGHGHSHGAAKKPAQAHGHSHNGKPCHGHGPQAAAKKPAAQAHGHSHNGKPCHGHGPQAGHGHSHGAPAEQTPQTPEEVEYMKKMKGVQLFMTQMVQPKIPIVWANFHKNENRDESKQITSGGLVVPFVEGETMNREEFHDFVEQFILSQSQADGYNSFRFVEAVQTETSFLVQLGFKDIISDPTAEVALPYQLFYNMFMNITARICMSRYDCIEFLFKNMGLGAMKLPNLPLTTDEKAASTIRKYSRDKIMPLLIEFIEANQKHNEGHENAAVASGFVAVTNSIEHGLNQYIDVLKAEVLGEDDKDNEDKFKDYVMDHLDILGHVLEVQTEIGNLTEQAIAQPDEVLGELKVLPKDKLFDADLIAANAQQLVIIPLLAQNPRCLQFICKEWDIDLVIDEAGKQIPAPEKKASE